MKYSNTSTSAHPRKQQATISSTVVRCICVTASCIVTACGLLGLGATCFIIKLTDPSSAPCPFLMTVIVFAVAGLLLFLSSVLLMVLCRRRNSMRRKALLEDLPAACIEEEYKQSEEEEKCNNKEKEKEKSESVNPEETLGSEDNFEIQKSADVSLWIEQQKSNDSPGDCFPLENTDGATSQDTDAENSEAEITPL